MIYPVKVFDKDGNLKRIIPKEELEEEQDGRDHDVQQFQETLSENGSLEAEVEELKEHLECEEDGYPTSDWFKEKLDFHIKYHFTNEGGEYYENMKDLKEKPNCLDDLIYGSLERIREENKKLKGANEIVEKLKDWHEARGHMGTAMDQRFMNIINPPESEEEEEEEEEN